MSNEPNSPGSWAGEYSRTDGDITSPGDFAAIAQLSVPPMNDRYPLLYHRADPPSRRLWWILIAIIILIIIGGILYLLYRRYKEKYEKDKSRNKHFF